MTLLDQLDGDMKSAMKAGDALKRDTLRMVMAAMKNKRIEKGEELDDAAQLAVLMSRERHDGYSWADFIVLGVGYKKTFFVIKGN